MSNLRKIEHDWYRGGIPSNVEIGRGVYIDSSYAFAACRSERTPSVVLKAYCGIYDRATLIVGTNGQVQIGEFTCLNGTTIVCHQQITIGAHCLFAWGVVISDSEPMSNSTIGERRSALENVTKDNQRPWPTIERSRPIHIKDNVWIGFESVILPGVTVGRGSIVGCKTIVSESIPEYSVVVGNPPRIVRTLNPDDTESARQQALKECFHAPKQ
jgi:acetyltransferase-like isoleucine patch superfamily enzyme